MKARIIEAVAIIALTMVLYVSLVGNGYDPAAPHFRSAGQVLEDLREWKGPLPF